MAGEGWSGIGTLIGVVASWFSPEQKIKNLRDKLDSLEKEKSKILIHKPSEKNAKRLEDIQRDIDSISRRLRNQA